MNEVFISDYFSLDDELDNLGVLDAIINKDSHFFINLFRLKNTSIPHFKDSYDRINQYFSEIMILLSNSKAKGDKFYREALRRFSFSGVKGINLGFSETGTDAGFGKKLSEKVISDAYDIVKAGSSQPEIFQLVGLFEENVAADRLSDMIATLISEDIQEYTRWVNKELNLNKETHPNVRFANGIAINPYKKSQLLYLPLDILHELPIARDWSDIDRVVTENKAIRNEINAIVGDGWAKMAASKKKWFLRDMVFMNKNRCAKVIENYREEKIEAFDPGDDWDYFLADAFKKMRQSGILDFLEHSDNSELSSWDAALKLLGLCKDFIENNKGWDIVHSVSTNKAEKTVQKLLQNGGSYFCEQNNIDLSFEPNEGPGPADLKVSRGNDKTVVEIKMSSNTDYIHGFEEQIEEYARAEHTDNRIYVYVQIEEHPGRDKKIKGIYEQKQKAGENPPYLFIIDAREKTSASKR